MLRGMIRNQVGKVLLVQTAEDRAYPGKEYEQYSELISRSLRFLSSG